MDNVNIYRSKAIIYVMTSMQNTIFNAKFLFEIINNTHLKLITITK